MSSATRTATAPLALRLWVLACALLSAAGWGLSALGQLNRAGYSIALACGASVALFCACFRPLRLPRFRRLLHRFRRPFPLAFLVLALLALLGGCLYAPSNFDALTCRTARVLHWLDAGHWHWIATDTRGALNTRTCAFEWVTAPILLFFHSDRWLFLLNTVSFLLLPGLVLSVFTRLGLSARAAWHWMWVFPAGLCFVLQAGSLGNDLFGAVLALAALDFALRARSDARPAANLRYSILSAALMTGAKFSNLTLLLPWSIAVLPALLRILSGTAVTAEVTRRASCPACAIARLVTSSVAGPALTLATLILALLASFAPTAWLNYRHTGDWTGMAAENSWLRPPGKLVCFTHNAALLTVQHLAPPVFPLSSAWDRFVQSHLPENWKATLDRFAEDGRNSYHVRELPAEEHAGLGLGLALLVTAPLLLALLRWPPKRSQSPAPAPIASPSAADVAQPSRLRVQAASRRLWRAALPLSPYVSLAVFMCKSGMVAVSRLVSPDYALLLPLPLLLSNLQHAVRTRWWRALAGLAFVFAFIAVIVTPARPLFPATRVFDWLERHHPSPMMARAETVYSVYRQRWNVFAPLLQTVPSGAKVLGAATGWTPETCLWRPLGQRRLIAVRSDLSPEKARQLGLEYVVVEVNGAEGALGRPLPEWLRLMHGVELVRCPIRLLASQPPADFALVRLGQDSSQ
jgi:hypothetical protein